MTPRPPVFDDGMCDCVHPDVNHDDGFGCTVPYCGCLAGWVFGDDE